MGGSGLLPLTCCVAWGQFLDLSVAYFLVWKTGSSLRQPPQLCTSHVRPTQASALGPWHPPQSLVKDTGPSPRRWWGRVSLGLNRTGHASGHFPLFPPKCHSLSPPWGSCTPSATFSCPAPPGPPSPRDTRSAPQGCQQFPAPSSLRFPLCEDNLTTDTPLPQGGGGKDVCTGPSGQGSEMVLPQAEQGSSRPGSGVLAC